MTRSLLSAAARTRGCRSPRDCYATAGGGVPAPPEVHRVWHPAASARRSMPGSSMPGSSCVARRGDRIQPLDEPKQLELRGTVAKCSWSPWGCAHQLQSGPHFFVDRVTLLGVTEQLRLENLAVVDLIKHELLESDSEMPVDVGRQLGGSQLPALAGGRPFGGTACCVP